MFPVEIRIPKGDEDTLSVRMTEIRQWLDNHRFEPSIFRHTLTSRGFVFLVDFKIKAEAVEFAMSFGGRILSTAEDTPMVDYNSIYKNRVGDGH
jgi:hypothetical protein